MIALLALDEAKNLSVPVRRHAAHASARPPEHSEATVDPRGSLQPEFDPAQADGGGHAAGMEQPRGPASFAGLFPACTPGRSESAMQRSNLEIPREILNESTKPLRRLPCRNLAPYTTGC